MQFFFGNFFHDVNSVAFAGVQRQYRNGKTGRHQTLVVDWALEGKLIRPTQAQIMYELGVMMQYYNSGISGSAGMLDNNGSFTPFLLDGNQALGGIVVTNPISHDGIRGAEGATYLKYKFGLQAEFPWANSYDLMSFSESLTFTDNEGGPIFVERIPMNGPPILQQVTEQSWYFATQQGQLSQPGPNPEPMSPIFDKSYIRTGSNSGKSITTSSPATTRGAPTEYGVSWRYEFISSAPLIGAPNIKG